jgi:ABC-type uncharacterized transport system permease subunit
VQLTKPVAGKHNHGRYRLRLLGFRSNIDVVCATAQSIRWRGVIMRKFFAQLAGAYRSLARTATYAPLRGK